VRAGNQTGPSIVRKQATRRQHERARRQRRPVPRVEDTLMCLGIPGRIVERPANDPDHALVDVDGTIRTINLALLEDAPPRPGEWILIHLGFALEKMSEAEAREALDTMTLVGERAADPSPASRPAATGS
jgi:hydrogenase expression/formation protein HypC